VLADVVVFRAQRAMRAEGKPDCVEFSASLGVWFAHAHASVDSQRLAGSGHVHRRAGMAASRDDARGGQVRLQHIDSVERS